MQYQIINKQGDEKKKSRLQNELNDFVMKLNYISSQSSRLVSQLRQLADQKQAEKILRKLKNS